MGKPAEGRRGAIFFGRSEGDEKNPATLDEALMSAAEQAVDSEVVNREQSVWFDIVSLEVEIGNQHVKTYVAGLTQQGGGG